MKAETLKKAILQYAMEGKLVAQDPNDEPASKLLKRIKAEKEQLIKDGKLKKEKPLPPITEEEIPYELPQGWEWVKLDEIALFENGDRSKNYPVDKDYVKEGIPFFGAKDIHNDKLIVSSELRYINQQKFDSLRSGKLKDKDIVVLLRGSVGKWAEFNKNNVFNTGFINAQMVILRLLDKSLFEYFKVVLNSNLFVSQISNKKSGSAVAQMSAKDLSEFIIILPPLEEQKRIVEKLEEILPLVEEYGKNEEKLSKLNETLPKKIRQSILQHAVQGKLVPQNPNDEPASELLKRIKSEKEQSNYNKIYNIVNYLTIPLNNYIEYQFKIKNN